VFVPDADGTTRSMLQEDDGVTFAADRGAFLRTTFDVTRRGARVTLETEVEGDGYPEFAREAFHLVVHGAAPSAVTVDGAQVRASDGRFVLANAGAEFTAEFDV